MSLITARGSQVEENLNAKKVDLSKVYIRLKEGESVKVRLLGINDFVEYESHGSFDLGVYTQPCITPTGQKCPLCTASKAGIEKFDVLYPRKRYLFAFGDIATGEVKVWDCSKGQAKTLLATIKEYEDNINEIAFNFKRSGTKVETTYTLNPILKLKGEDEEKFNSFNGVTVEDSFFEGVLQPRSVEMMLDVLNNAEFPVEEYFPNYVAKNDDITNNI